MGLELARSLFESGRAHALSAHLLYRASIDAGHDQSVADPEHFAFNGTHSLSVHYLLGLGIELMLKAAICGWDGACDEKRLREIGHDLLATLDAAEVAGFHSSAPRLRDLLEVLQEPYKAHWFRYLHPEQFPLPGDFVQVVETLATLDDELRTKLWI